MKGIILAGGRATRLYPVTKSICKQMLPVYDKPMIYYPLSVLMLAGIREILVISTPRDLPRFKELLEDGGDLGIELSYLSQEEPRGIAESFIIAQEFIGKDCVSLILGDNIFYGHNLTNEVLPKKAPLEKEAAIIFGCYVKNPQEYGVIGLDKKGKVVSLQEKPKKPESNWAVTGLYFYGNDVVRIAKSLKPSARGELEITDVNKEYLKRGSLEVKLLGRGYAWLDAGTHDSLADASMFIKTIEERQDLKIGCIEEVAYRMGYINREKLAKLAGEIKTGYGDYLRRILDDGR